MTFGQFLRSIRRDMSQRELARMCGVTGQYINDLEKDRRNPPPYAMLKRISEALGESIDLLCYHAGILPPDALGCVDEATIIRAMRALREGLMQ